jgi:hypothetical protein
MRCDGWKIPKRAKSMCVDTHVGSPCVMSMVMRSLRSYIESCDTHQHMYILHMTSSSPPPMQITEGRRVSPFAMYYIKRI